MAKILCFFIFLYSCPAVGLDLDSIKQFYQSQPNMTATIFQSKTADYLILPLDSKVKLEKQSDGTIIWKMLEPLQTTYKINHNGFFIDGKNESSLVKGKTGQFKKLIGVIKSLVSMDLNALEQHFEMKFKDSTLHAKPLSKSIFPYEFKADFHNSKVIDQLVMWNGKEKMTLVFKNVVFSAEAKGNL